MRTTVTLDDDLLERAREATGRRETSAVIREALEALVQREASRRLIALGGTMPDAEAPPRRRFPPT
jgi:Arc/MetJ family transcription regulator